MKLKKKTMISSPVGGHLSPQGIEGISAKLRVLLKGNTNNRASVPYERESGYSFYDSFEFSKD